MVLRTWGTHFIPPFNCLLIFSKNLIFWKLGWQFMLEMTRNRWYDFYFNHNMDVSFLTMPFTTLFRAEFHGKLSMATVSSQCVNGGKIFHHSFLLLKKKYIYEKFVDNLTRPTLCLSNIWEKCPWGPTIIAPPFPQTKSHLFLMLI